MNRLTGKTAVITGAAQGIGLGIAQRFADEGARLLLVDVREEGLLAASDQLRGSGASIENLVGDISEPEVANLIAKHGEEVMGGVNILINNAGIGAAGTVEEFDQEKWDRVIAVNLTAAYRITRHLLPAMVAQAYGRIINISSMNGIIGMRRDSAYAASKSGLHALTRSVAVDYGRRGITCNAIAPGPIETPLNTSILKDQKSWFLRTVVDNKPIAGLGHVDDIAATAAFLASDEARFITGQIIAVDGGLSATRFVPNNAEF